MGFREVSVVEVREVLRAWLVMALTEIPQLCSSNFPTWRRCSA